MSGEPGRDGRATEPGKENLNKFIFKLYWNYIILGPKGQPGDTGAPGLPGNAGMIGDAGTYDLVYYFHLNLYMSIFYSRCSGKLMVDK
jgi:hypothetical protein